MRRKSYVEPPMKFDIALKKYVPDLPQKPNKNALPISDSAVRNLILICLSILVLWLVLYYFLGN